MTNSSQRATSSEWLVGGGERGEVIRATDWTDTPLGPRETWPLSLRTVVSLVIESQLPMVLLWGPELVLLYNDAYQAIAADEHPPAFGHALREARPEGWRINEPILAAVLERGESACLEDQLVSLERHGQREDAYLTVSYSPVRGEDGAVAGSLVTLLETTKRVRQYRSLATARERAEAAAKRERELLAKVIERIPVMVATYDPTLQSFRLNEEFRRVLGWTDEDARAGDLMSLCYPDAGYREAVRRFMAAAEPGWREFVVTAKDGSKVESSWANVRLSDNTQVGIGIDLRERKQAEAALREANERLVEANLRKNEFLAMLSHELRNPLAPIRSSVYILEHAASGGEQARRARQVIDRQAQHMTRLIEDLLDVTRISRGKINLRRERMDLNALVQGTAEDHRELYARSGIALEVEEAGQALWIDGDPTRLAQVIGNLLHNAAKFTPRSGKVVLSVSANGEGEAVVRVRDNGVGMTPETLGRIFEPFVQGAQNIERSRGGLGLGLALVKGLVEMHGGKVTAASEGEGRGSELTVRLPLQAPARPKLAVVPASQQRSSRARRVLVIEDNVDAAESLREALEIGEHEVAVAYTGPEGVEAARRLRPDVVLCDIGLPGMDGYEVARAVRADPALRSTYLVALSGYALQEDVSDAQEAGFDRHMAKPPGIEALEKLLTEVPARATAE